MINVQETDIAELPALLAELYELREALMIWGKPGIGKSYGVQDFTRRNNMALIDVRLTTLFGPDLRGICWPDIETMRTVWLRPEFLPLEEGPGVVFFDEITAADDDMQASSYQLVHDRCVGRHKLGPKWWVVGAGNGLEDGAISHRMGSALADRFIHIKLHTSATSWIAWALENDIHPAVLSFIKTKPDFLQGSHPAADETDEDLLVNPTPRSWARVSRVLYSVTNPVRRSILINGLVGKAAAAEFNWEPGQDLVRYPPQSVLADPTANWPPCNLAEKMVAG